MAETEGRDDSPQDDYYDDDEDGGYCCRCDNTGMIVVCVDDLCRGAGECMHGDGEIICPDCNGACGDW